MWAKHSTVLAANATTVHITFFHAVIVAVADVFGRAKLPKKPIYGLGVHIGKSEVGPSAQCTWSTHLPHPARKSAQIWLDDMGNVGTKP